MNDYGALSWNVLSFFKHHKKIKIKRKERNKKLMECVGKLDNTLTNADVRKYNYRGCVYYFNVCEQTIRAHS